MNITKDRKNDKTIIRLAGRLDAVSVPQVEAALNQEMGKTGPLLLDFAKVDYLSSAGMRLLLSSSKRTRLYIFSVADDVMEIIQMAGFEKILNIQPDEQKALATT